MQRTNERAVEHQHWEIHHIQRFNAATAAVVCFIFIIHLLLVFHDLWLICIWILKSISLCTTLCTVTANKTKPNWTHFTPNCLHQIAFTSFSKMKIPFLSNAIAYSNPLKNYIFEISSINKLKRMTQ